MRRWLLLAAGLLAGAALAAPPPARFATGAQRYVVFDGLRYTPQQFELASRSPVPVTPPEYGSDAIRLTRSRDGHYYLAGAVNGFPLVFMLDTGASVTAIPATVARNAGLRVGRSAEVATASGRAEAAVSFGNEMLLGRIPLSGMEVATVASLTVPLLGMNALRHFNITQEGDVMLLRLAR